MMRRGSVAAVFLLAGGFFQAKSADILVITHSPNGAWALQHGESLSVNGKDKVRRVDTATVSTATWDAKSLGRLQDVPIESFTVIRRTAGGIVVARQDSSQQSSQAWQSLLPDGVKPQAPELPATLWKSSSLALKRDKKDKLPITIQMEELYGIVIGLDAASSAASLVTGTGMHKVPGVGDAEAFRNIVELLPVAIKAFPSGEPAVRMRDFVREGMMERLKTWNGGDASRDVLDQSMALTRVSEVSFANDARQADLRKQVRDTTKALDRKVSILRALDAGKQSDAFLLAYRDFEPYDKSFPELSAARRAHMKTSAQAHTEASETARAAGDYATSIRHLRIAQWRDPSFTESANQLEQVRLEVARLSSQQFAETRQGLDRRSPKQVQLQRRMLMTEQYLNDDKKVEAENALKEAESMDKDEPRIKFLEARLALLHGDLARALALLDLYAGLAVTNQEFDEGEKLRASVQYKIEIARKDTRSQLSRLAEDQRFAGALEASVNGLKLDNEDTQFLFQAGVNACVLRNCEHGAPLLRRFIDITDSTQGKREQRILAMRLLKRAEKTSASVAGAPGSSSSWFSGAPLAAGVYYDPISLAFQPKVARVKGSNHLTVTYDWGDELLNSVHTKYEDKKTTTNILKVVAAGAMSSQGLGSTVNWKTADRETNDFFFNYYDDKRQVFKIGRDNVLTKSRTIPINIPGIGGFGAIGALGSLGSLGSLGGSLGGAMGGLTSAGGFGGVSGFGGVGGASALRALATSRSVGAGGGISGGALGNMLRQQGSSQSASIYADPGESTAGFVTLWNSPRLDTEVAFAATGKRIAVAFSGNSYFQPFVWDSIHSFELDYDEEGRIRHAWELYNPTAPRLDFTWEGRRLMQITGHASDGGATVYSRTLQYSGDKLMGETINFGGKTSHIKYKYDKQDHLTEADCEEDHSLDGRSRQIEFLVSGVKGAKR